MSDSQPTAILTNPQREYLKGERKPTQERTMRTRIRERIRAGLGDIALVATELEDGDWDLLLEEFETWVKHERELATEDSDAEIYGRAKPNGLDDGRLMTRHLHGVALFLYLALAKHTGEQEHFRSVVATAIEIAETTPTERASVSVNIQIDREPRPTELVEKFEQGEQLTEDEFETLVDAGEIDPMALLKQAGIVEDPDATDTDE